MSDLAITSRGSLTDGFANDKCTDIAASAGFRGRERGRLGGWEREA